MITLIHIAFDLFLLVVISISKLINITFMDILLILSASLFDIDHLFSKPIYDPKRNQFKVHLFHKYWKLVLVLAIIMLFIRPILFLGIGLISHLLLDYIYVKMHKI